MGVARPAAVRGAVARPRAARRRTRGSGRGGSPHRRPTSSTSRRPLMASASSRSTTTAAPTTASRVRLRPATTLALVSPPTAGTFGNSPTVTAKLSDAGSAPSGQEVTIAIGGSAAIGTTGADGRVTLQVPLTTVPGEPPGRRVLRGRTTTTCPRRRRRAVCDREGAGPCRLPAETSSSPGAAPRHRSDADGVGRRQEAAAAPADRDLHPAGPVRRRPLVDHGLPRAGQAAAEVSPAGVLPRHRDLRR